MDSLSSVDLSLLELLRSVEKTGYRFTTVTPETHRHVNRRPGNEVARDLRGVFGWSRPFDAAILPAGMFDLLQAAEAIIPDRDRWRSRYRISTLGEGLFLHSAFPTEDEAAVFFGPDTYRFAAALEQAQREGDG